METISVAIVGRPNVGKSRLFNRLAGRRISIVHDRPGVTRDVVVADSPEGYVLMDTGGIGMQPEMTSVEIQNATEQQADFAIRAATLLLFVVDGRDGLLPLDETLSIKLRKMGKQPKKLLRNYLPLPPCVVGMIVIVPKSLSLGVPMWGSPRFAIDCLVWNA